MTVWDRSKYQTETLLISSLGNSNKGKKAGRKIQILPEKKITKFQRTEKLQQPEPSVSNVSKYV